MAKYYDGIGICGLDEVCETYAYIYMIISNFSWWWKNPQLSMLYKFNNITNDLYNNNDNNVNDNSKCRNINKIL